MTFHRLEFIEILGNPIWAKRKPSCTLHQRKYFDSQHLKSHFMRYFKTFHVRIQCNEMVTGITVARNCRNQKQIQIKLELNSDSFFHWKKMNIDILKARQIRFSEFYCLSFLIRGFLVDGTFRFDVRESDSGSGVSLRVSGDVSGVIMSRRGDQDRDQSVAWPGSAGRSVSRSVGPGLR